MNSPNILLFIRKITATPITEHLRFWLPQIYALIGRFHIFRNTNRKSNLLNWFYWLILGKHVVWRGYGLSNYGVWLAVRSGDATYHYCLDATYMNNLEKILMDISQSVVFIDIGANIGIFSLIAAQNPNISEIHSFEPDLETFNFLNMNVTRNSILNLVSHNSAIASRAGRAKLLKIPGHSGASALVSKDEIAFQDFAVVEVVNHKYLNSLFSGQQNFFVKIDVEGNEIEVLQALSRSKLFPQIRNFFIEFDVLLGQVHEVESFLRLNGFKEIDRWGSIKHWDALWSRQS